MPLSYGQPASVSEITGARLRGGPQMSVAQDAKTGNFLTVEQAKAAGPLTVQWTGGPSGRGSRGTPTSVRGQQMRAEQNRAAQHSVSFQQETRATPVAGAGAAGGSSNSSPAAAAAASEPDHSTVEGKPGGDPGAGRAWFDKLRAGVTAGSSAPADWQTAQRNALAGGMQPAEAGRIATELVYPHAAPPMAYPSRPPTPKPPGFSMQGMFDRLRTAGVPFTPEAGKPMLPLIKPHVNWNVPGASGQPAVQKSAVNWDVPGDSRPTQGPKPKVNWGAAY